MIVTPQMERPDTVVPGLALTGSNYLQLKFAASSTLPPPLYRATLG